MESFTRSATIALTAMLCMAGLSGCGSTPDARSAWQMPGAMPPGHGPASEARGYAWVYASGGNGAPDASHDLPPGDLPETARTPRDPLWRNDEAQARRLAVQLNRPIFIDFYAEWCEPCMHLAAETFRDPQLRQTLQDDYVTLQVDVTEETMANREQLARYKVDQLPTLLVVAPDGEELDRIDRFISPAALQQRLQVLTTQLSPAASEPTHRASTPH